MREWEIRPAIEGEGEEFGGSHYREKSALPLIESAYQSLTYTEKMIARYFLEENELEDLSLKALAAKLAVSEATLVR